MHPGYIAISGVGRTGENFVLIMIVGGILCHFRIIFDCNMSNTLSLDLITQVTNDLSNEHIYLLHRHQENIVGIST